MTTEPFELIEEEEPDVPLPPPANDEIQSVVNFLHDRGYLTMLDKSKWAPTAIIYAAHSIDCSTRLPEPTKDALYQMVLKHIAPKQKQNEPIGWAAIKHMVAELDQLRVNIEVSSDELHDQIKKYFIQDIETIRQDHGQHTLNLYHHKYTTSISLKDVPVTFGVGNIADIGKPELPGNFALQPFRHRTQRQVVHTHPVFSINDYFAMLTKYYRHINTGGFNQPPKNFTSLITHKALLNALDANLVYPYEHTPEIVREYLVKQTTTELEGKYNDQINVTVKPQQLTLQSNYELQYQ